MSSSATSRAITSSACTPDLPWTCHDPSNRELAARPRPPGGVGPLPTHRTLVGLAPCVPNRSWAKRVTGAFHRLLDPTQSAYRPRGEDVGRHPRRALLRGVLAPLSRRQNPAARIARWRVDRSTRGSGHPHRAAAPTVQSAVALTSLPRAPHLFGRPLLRPLHRHVLAVERVVDRVGRREDLDHVQDLEARFAQQPDEIAVPELELDLSFVGPLHTVQAE